MGMGRWGDISFSLKNISSLILEMCCKLEYLWKKAIWIFTGCKTSLPIFASCWDCPSYLASAETVCDLLLLAETTVCEKWLPAETVHEFLPAESLGREQDLADRFGRTPFIMHKGLSREQEIRESLNGSQIWWIVAAASEYCMAE